MASSVLNSGGFSSLLSPPQNFCTAHSSRYKRELLFFWGDCLARYAQEAARRRKAELADEINRLTAATERASESAAAALSALKSELANISH